MIIYKIINWIMLIAVFLAIASWGLETYIDLRNFICKWRMDNKEKRERNQRKIK